MAATTVDRDTKEMESPFAFYHSVLGTDSTQYLKGELVGIDLDTGKLVKAVAGDLTIQVIGRCEENYLTGSSNTRKIRVKSGIFNYASGATFEAIVVADRGQVCYVLDNQTVGLSGATGANALAGRIYDVDSDGVWVATHFPMPQLAPIGPTGV